MNLEINGDCKYAELKKEILEAKKAQKEFLCSEAIKGLNIKFYYEKSQLIN